MAFDPFGDFASKGYLRNHAGAKDPRHVKELEHDSYLGNVDKALVDLRGNKPITVEDIKKTHETLFKDVYPWAGQIREINVHKNAATRVDFQFAGYIERGLDYALQTGNNAKAFKQDPGKVIGELAYAHPFLDGNGRAITTVVEELSNRAGFHIDWQATNKADYLKALTNEINQPDQKHLTNYLQPHIRDGARPTPDAVNTLSNLKGLNVHTPIPPTLTVVAGVNGSGKSSLIASQNFAVDKVIDPDQIARRINPKDPATANALAAREAIEQRRSAIKSGTSFLVETTLSGNSTIKLIDQAKEAGFKVDLHYIGLKDVKQSQTRVDARVSTGGHDIKSIDINRRFNKSLNNLPEAISKADSTTLYDNSTSERHKRIGSISDTNISFEKNAPTWATKASLSSAKLDVANATNDAELQRATQKSVYIASAAGLKVTELQSVSEGIQKAQALKEQLSASKINNSRGNDGFGL